MQLIAKSDLSTGNKSYASYALKSNDLMFVFSAPSYVQADAASGRPLARRRSRSRRTTPKRCGPSWTSTASAVRAVGVVGGRRDGGVRKSVANGGRSAFDSMPTDLGGGGVIAEGPCTATWCCGDVSGVDDDAKKTFLPKYIPTPVEDGREPLCYGLQRLDHAVGNVHDLLETVDYITAFTGMHQFAEFTAEDVGTVDSGLNSMVLANNSEFILLPVNEPTFGTKRKSQIQTYLEQNGGPGLQHLALKTDDIFATVREMRRHGGGRGGFEFQKPASADYYAKLPERIGADALTKEQFAQVQELGLLVDRDDQGVLVQIFTKPLGDRPTVFIEIIQRVGCARAPAGDRRRSARARANRRLRRLRQGQLLGALQEHRAVRAHARGVRRGAFAIYYCHFQYERYGSRSNHMFAKGLLCA